MILLRQYYELLKDKFRKQNEERGKNRLLKLFDYPSNRVDQQEGISPPTEARYVRDISDIKAPHRPPSPFNYLEPRSFPPPETTRYSFTDDDDDGEEEEMDDYTKPTNRPLISGVRDSSISTNVNDQFVAELKEAQAVWRSKTKLDQLDEV